MLSQRANVEDHPPTTHKNNGVVWKLLLGLTGLFLVIFLTLSQLFAWGRVNVLADRVVELRSQLESRGTKADCLSLYRNDVTTAIGVALAANNDLFIAVATRPPAGDTPEEITAQAAFLKTLGEQLEAANTPLEEASAALSAYDALNPKPLVCPHPSAADENGSG